MSIFFFLFLSGSIPCNSQNLRDLFIKDSINPLLNEQDITKAEYLKLKKAVLKLEKQYGYETNIKKRLIDKSFTQNDSDFFKTELTILVKECGLDIAYLRESESYYKTIINGSLSKWFKKMYLKNHTQWLAANFDKQKDIRELNTINEIDQRVTSFAMNVLNVQGLDSIQQQKIKDLIGECHLKNIEPVLEISKKRKLYPNDKNFAVLQKGFDTVLIHNFQFKENMNYVWTALFPYIKTAYLQKEVTNVIFNNYDFYYYQHYGMQVFDSYTIDEIPEQFRKNNRPLPLKDKEWFDGIKKEFEWTD